MKFVKLKVEHFCGIASADIEFGAGLNILYGPNELGKSSLAEAIRAVLLVQTNSSAHHPWITWEGHECPFVELVFRTRDLMYRRIRKSFGKGGNNSAVLDESNDGVTFSNYAKGRRADGELRKLLQWGIPEPGGQNRVKGMPSTFLTSLLLPRQDGVHEIFGQSLDKDFDDSGKKLVTDALQALAADPLFTHVLNLAQAKVDDVFDAKGNYRKRQNSALRRIQEEITQGEDVLRELSKQVQESQAEKLKVEELQGKQIELATSHQQAREAQSQLKEQSEKYKTLEQALIRAKESLKLAEVVWQKVEELKQAETRLQTDLQKREDLLAASSRQLSDAERLTKQAQEEFQRACSSQSEAEREIKKRDLENWRLELNAKLQETSRVLENMAKVRAASESLRAIEGSLKAHQQDLTTSNEFLARLESDLKGAQTETAILAATETYLEQKKVDGELDAAKKRVSESKQLQSQADQKLKEAEAIRQELAVLDLPDEKAIEALRSLATHIQVAEATLAVGLSAELKPLQPLQLNVSSDAEPAKPTHASEPTLFTADKQLRIDIEGVAEIQITGGKPEARDKAEGLQKRWRNEVVPVMEKAGVGTVQELNSLSRQSREKYQQATDLTKEADSIRLQLVAAGNAEALVTELGSRSAELQGQSAATAQVENIKTDLSSERVAHQKQETAALLQRLQKKISDEQLKKTRLETQTESLKSNFEKEERAYLVLKEDHSAESGTTEESVRRQASDFQAELNTTEGQIAALTSETTNEVEEAEKKHKDAVSALKKRNLNYNALAQSKEAAARELANCKTELRIRKEVAEKSDLDAARKAAQEAETALAEMTTSGEELMKQLATANELVEAGEQSLAQNEASLREAQGALKKTGGNVIIERKEQYSQALEHKLERQEQIELQYAGWKKLLETLKEVETNDASHLGQAISSPVAERFNALTRDRYGELELGPNLESGGILAAGQAREIVRLSIGTRDQLSTIFRLALAEHLDSVLVLDDQLAQSDALRMAWFREQLRKSASKTQILVFTCRHEDYLLDEEMPKGKESSLDSGDGLMHSVNLQALVEHSYVIRNT